MIDYKGPCEIDVSCVTMKKPYRAHPYKLVTKNETEKGYSTVKLVVTDENREVMFPHMGINCVPKEDFKKSLDKRKIDPFGGNYQYLQ